MTRKFAVFILSHGRAGRVLSYYALRKCGYTGKIYVITDNEDSQLSEYKKEFGNDLITFNKTEFAAKVDACDNYDRRNSVVYARNYNFVVARELGLTHFLQLDDDYTYFGYTLDSSGNYVTKDVLTSQLDAIFDLFLNFLDSTCVTTVAFAQGGDLIGGSDGSFLENARLGKLSRKAMNSFFFRANDDVVFRGRVNDDVNLYVEQGRRGQLFITIPSIRLWQPQTQTADGGCTDIYKEMGTYIKSFYSVIVAPSCVQLAMMSTTHRRIHHMVRWKYACPVILDEKYRKPRPT